MAQELLIPPSAEQLVPDVIIFEQDGKTILGSFLSSDGAMAKEIAKLFGGTALRFLKNGSILLNKPPPAGDYALFKTARGKLN